MPYKAFISYSHTADSKLAPALQSALRRIGIPWYRRAPFRIFSITQVSRPTQRSGRPLNPRSASQNIFYCLHPRSRRNHLG